MSMHIFDFDTVTEKEAVRSMLRGWGLAFADPFARGYKSVMQ